MNIERIEQLRKRRGLTQAEFAESIDFTTNGYQKLIKSGDPRASVLSKISQVYGVDISYFFKDATEHTSVGEPHRNYGADPCAGQKRENDLLRNTVELLTSNNKALQQALDVMSDLLEVTKQKNIIHSKAHKK